MKRLLILGLAAIAPLGVYAHEGHSHGEEQAHAPVAGSVQRLADGSVHVPKTAQRRMTIRTLVTAQGEHALPVELNGRVVMDPNAGGRVQAPFAGQIVAGPQGIAVVGRKVKQGEVLALLRPTASAIDLANQKAQLAELGAERVVAEARAKRLQALEGSVARKDIDAAIAEAHSLRQREQAVAASVSGAHALRAPVSGVVASANAIGGQIVDGKDLLFEIVDPNRLMIEAQTADATLPARIDKAAMRDGGGLKLDYVGGGLALRDGGLPLLFRVSAKQAPAQLALGQPVTVIAHLKDRVPGIALPSEAVVRNASNEPIVWIKTGAQRFLPQVVAYKPLDARTVVVTQGLAADNRVVTAGAPLINQIR